MSTNSESVEMYLKSVAELGGATCPVAISRVAERMGVSSVSANEMMKRLETQAFITHQPYKGVVLTENGRSVANNVIRRQRLWECFLVDHLALDWGTAHDLACNLEHATTNLLSNALADYLDQPETAPYGSPIPGQTIEAAQKSLVSLNQLQPGENGRIQAIKPENSEILNYFQTRAIKPGLMVTVLEAAPLHGPLTIQINAQQLALGLNLAALILVERTNQ